MFVAVFYFLRRLFIVPFLLLSPTTQLRVITGFFCALIFLWACTMSSFGTGLFLLVIAGRSLYELYYTKSALYVPAIIAIIATFILHIGLVLQDDKQLLLLTSYVAVLHDCGGYIAGNLFGKHKIAPTLSPKKTVEGFLGSFLFIGVGILLLPFLFSYQLEYEWYDIPVLTTLSLWGDLLFSKIKRDSEIKDFSNLLPGHGGILDRIDSTVLITWYLLLMKIYN